jgi:hypothetical protein
MRGDVTYKISCGFKDLAIDVTCSITGKPPTGWKTFDSLEFIRLLWPAAKITMVKDIYGDFGIVQ